MPAPSAVERNEMVDKIKSGTEPIRLSACGYLEYHKGQPCAYVHKAGIQQPLTCQEGYCCRCQIYLDFMKKEKARL